MTTKPSAASKASLWLKNCATSAMSPMRLTSPRSGLSSPTAPGEWPSPWCPVASQPGSWPPSRDGHLTVIPVVTTQLNDQVFKRPHHGWDSGNKWEAASLLSPSSARTMPKDMPPSRQVQPLTQETGSASRIRTPSWFLMSASLQPPTRQQRS